MSQVSPCCYLNRCSSYKQALDTEVVRAHHDLHAQMTGRKDRLSFLIKFINDNSALTKVGGRGSVHLPLLTAILHRCHSVAVKRWRQMQRSCTLHISYGFVITTPFGTLHSLS